MTITQTILEQFREREKEIKKECDRLDAEMDKKRKGYEKVQTDALDKITKARAALARMTADYHALGNELEAKAAAEILATAATAEQVKAGTISLDTFMRTGLSPDAIKVKAAEEVRAKLVAAVEIIRAKRHEIIMLELAEAEARQNLIYCMCYPGQTQIKKLEAEIETLKRGVSAVYGGYSGASHDVDRAKNNVSLCEENTIGGLTWASLTYEELKDLRLDPRIRDRKNFKALEGLGGIIASAKPGHRYYLVMACSGWGRDPGYVVRDLDEGGDMITTTTTSAPEKK